MIDFTSSLFLGRRDHGVPSCAPLTSGRPAAFQEPLVARRVAARVAGVQAAEAGVIHRSALHALIDVLNVVTSRSGTVVMDAAIYPVARAAGAAVTSGGAGVVTYDHHDAAQAMRICEHVPRPVVLTDGWCTGCGLPAPLPRLHRAVQDTGSWLVVDDTQACGVLGMEPTDAMPFGVGGGGTMRWFGVPPHRTIQVSSLAKGFGAPLAVTSGPASIVGRLADAGMRWHASPPTSADLAAADTATRATLTNDLRRRRLAALVARLRAGVQGSGLEVDGLPFPVVSLPVAARSAMVWQRRLRLCGLRSLALQPRCRRSATLTVMLTTRHREDEIDALLAALAQHPELGIAG